MVHKMVKRATLANPVAVLTFNQGWMTSTTTVWYTNPIMSRTATTGTDTNLHKPIDSMLWLVLENMNSAFPCGVIFIDCYCNEVAISTPSSSTQECPQFLVFKDLNSINICCCSLPLAVLRMSRPILRPHNQECHAFTTLSAGETYLRNLTFRTMTARTEKFQQ